MKKASICTECEFCITIPGWKNVKCKKGKFEALPIDHPFITLERECPLYKEMEDNGDG